MNCFIIYLSFLFQLNKMEVLFWFQNICQNLSNICNDDTSRYGINIFVYNNIWKYISNSCNSKVRYLLEITKMEIVRINVDAKDPNTVVTF